MKKIHGICSGSQAYVAFYCNPEQEHYISFQSGNTPPEVYEADVDGKGDGLYSFSNSKITCPDCLDKIKR